MTASTTIGDNSEFMLRVALILRDLLGKPKPPPKPEGETLDWLEKLIGKAQTNHDGQAQTIR